MLTFYGLEPLFKHPFDFLGGMWATIAAVFVFKEARNLRLSAAVARFFATCVSVVLTFVYLLFLPFSSVGMAALIGLGTLVVMVLGRRDDVVTTGITTAVIMVVAGLGPANLGWTIPLLRLLDTVIGIGVALGCWWLGTFLFVFKRQWKKR